MALTPRISSLCSANKHDRISNNELISKLLQVGEHSPYLTVGCCEARNNRLLDLEAPCVSPRQDSVGYDDTVVWKLRVEWTGCLGEVIGVPGEYPVVAVNGLVQSTLV